MKGCIIAIILLFSLNPLGAFAQGPATGCLLSDNKVYTSKPLLSATMYDPSPATPLSDNYCSWTPVSTTDCSVCFNGLINALGLCVGLDIFNPPTIVNGKSGTFTMVECNLDDHSWLLGAVAGLFGMLIIKKRNKP
jgi:hypothetical protein